YNRNSTNSGTTKHFFNWNTMLVRCIWEYLWNTINRCTNQYYIIRAYQYIIPQQYNITEQLLDMVKLAWYSNISCASNVRCCSSVWDASGLDFPSYRLDVSGDVNSTGVYRVYGTDISTAITGITPGIVSASKASIVDVNANTSQLGSAIAFQNDSSILTVSLASIRLDRLSSTQGELEFSTPNGTALANTLRICNDGVMLTEVNTKMILKKTGYLGIGTNSPTTYLTVSGTVSNTYNAGGALYALGGTTLYGTSVLGPVTVSASAHFSDPFSVHQSIVVLIVDERRTSYKGSNDTIPNIGFIAQDLNNLGYLNMLTLTENQNLKKETKDDIDSVQMNIDYTKITAINAMMKKLIKRNEELEAKLKLSQ
ncbi:TPA: hypothetical protein N0F65_002849, partial [Lagenidium giganteum]